MKPTALRPWILLSFFVTIGTVGWVASLRGELVIPGKTNALYSLETAWTPERVKEVLHYWDGKHDYAWKLNTIDLLMPFGYGVFFILSILYLGVYYPKVFGKYARLLIALTVIAVVCDIFEGMAAFVWLKGNIDAWTPLLVGMGSTAKFIITLPLTALIIGTYLVRIFRARNNPLMH